MAWLTGWTYRQSHTISGSSDGAQTNYQVKIIVDYGSGSSSGDTIYVDGNCKTDFSDIRFTSSDGETVLDYWIEDYTVSDNAIIWVEVDKVRFNQIINNLITNAIKFTSPNGRIDIIIRENESSVINNHNMTPSHPSTFSKGI